MLSPASTAIHKAAAATPFKMNMNSTPKAMPIQFQSVACFPRRWFSNSRWRLRRPADRLRAAPSSSQTVSKNAGRRSSFFIVVAAAR